ncbi:MAG: hypothetical protein ABIJ34_06540 [archaeon]
MAAYANVILVVDQSDAAPYFGENMDVTFDTTMQDDVGMDAEAFISSLCRYDFVTNFATLNAKTKRLLSEYVSRSIALAGIAYNMAGFSSRIEAEDMLNIHLYRMRLIEKMLADQKTVTYMV